jgi:hypothetical protein
MSRPDSNGPLGKPSELITLPDGSRLFRMADDDPDTVVRRWPNGDGPRSDLAFPPKKDDIRTETRSQELLALMNAMTARKRARSMEYLLWEDVLDVLHDMGYRKVAPPAPAEPAATDGSATP